MLDSIQVSGTLTGALKKLPSPRRADGERSHARILRDEKEMARVSMRTHSNGASCILCLFAAVALLATASQLFAVTTIDQYVVYGENGVKIGGNSTVNGLVGARNLPGPALVGPEHNPHNGSPQLSHISRQALRRQSDHRACALHGRNTRRPPGCA